MNAITYKTDANLVITGERLINGSRSSSHLMSAVSAFVQQSDLFFGLMTSELNTSVRIRSHHSGMIAIHSLYNVMFKVKEHLTFQAMVRMGDDFTKEEKLDKVETLLTRVGCVDVKLV